MQDFIYSGAPFGVGSFEAVEVAGTGTSADSALDWLVAQSPPPFSERITTFAPNLLAVTDYYSSLIPELAQRNAQALVFGSLGYTFTQDQEVVVGHRHDTVATRIRWRQLSNVLFFNNGASSIGAAPDECYDALLISEAGATEKAWTRLLLSYVDAAAVLPRVRLSHAAGPTSITVTLDYYSEAAVLFTSTSNVISTAAVRSRAWADLTSVNLAAMAPDEARQRIPVIVRLSASRVAAGDNTALHELAFGVVQ